MTKNFLFGDRSAIYWASLATLRSWFCNSYEHFAGDALSFEFIGK